MSGLLSWSDDDLSRFSDNADAIVAEDGDRTFHVWPVRGDVDEILGYRIVLDISESGDSFLGSVEIQGELGELTLHDAKAVADAEGESLLDELQLALRAVVSGWKDRAGNLRVRFDSTGGMFYPVGEGGGLEIHIFAGTDYEDMFDATRRYWMVGWDNLFNDSDHLESLLQQHIAKHAKALGLSKRGA